MYTIRSCIVISPDLFSTVDVVHFSWSVSPVWGYDSDTIRITADESKRARIEKIHWSGKDPKDSRNYMVCILSKNKKENMKKKQSQMRSTQDFNLLVFRRLIPWYSRQAGNIDSWPLFSFSFVLRWSLILAVRRKKGNMLYITRNSRQVSRVIHYQDWASLECFPLCCFILVFLLF